MHRYSAVLFDFDGTVAYTASDVWDSVRYGFEQCGLTLPEAYSADDRNLAFLVEDMVSQLYPGSEPGLGKRVDDAVSQHYRHLTTYPGTVMYEGIQELLELLLREGIPTGILSNKGHYSLGRILELKGWRKYFTSYRGTLETDVDLKGKVARLANYMQQFDVTDGIYIGDSAWDVEAAKVNGLRSVGVLYGDGDKELVKKSKPDVLCATPKELFHYFEKGRVSHAE